MYWSEQEVLRQRKESNPNFSAHRRYLFMLLLLLQHSMIVLLFLVPSSAQLQSISLPDPRGFLPTKFGPETLINCTDSHAPSGPSNAQKLAKRDPDSYLFPFRFAPKLLANLYWLILAWVKCLYSLNLRKIISFRRLSAKFSADETFVGWNDVHQIHPLPPAEGAEEQHGDLLNTNNNF